MAPSFFIQLPNGRTISAMQHPDPRTAVQQIFQDFNPASGIINTKQLMPIDCAAGTPTEQGIPAERRKGRLQLWLNLKGVNYVVIPVPDASGKTSNLMLPLDSLTAFGDTLKNLQTNLTRALAPKPEAVATPAPVELPLVEKTEAATTEAHEAT